VHLDARVPNVARTQYHLNQAVAYLPQIQRLMELVHPEEPDLDVLEIRGMNLPSGQTHKAPHPGTIDAT